MVKITFWKYKFLTWSHSHTRHAGTFIHLAEVITQKIIVCLILKDIYSREGENVSYRS